MFLDFLFSIYNSSKKRKFYEVRFLREALHVIDKEPFILPYSATIEEVTNFKKLAEKDLFRCP
jgi:hypothetical protein